MRSSGIYQTRRKIKLLSGVFAAAILCILPITAKVHAITGSSSTPTYVKTSARSGTGAVGSPTGIAVDSTGNVYVTDSIDFDVKKYTKDGTYITTLGTYGTGNYGFNNPTDLAIDSEDNLYVQDAENYMIKKYTSNGTYVTSWGSMGTGNGQFAPGDGNFSYGMMGLATDRQDNVYVSDGGNYRIQKFTKDGQFITSWSTNADGMSASYGLATDSNNNVYATDVLNGKIVKFSSTGAALASWNTPGADAHSLTAPLGITVDTYDNIYVGDVVGQVINEYTDTGTFVRSWNTVRPDDSSSVSLMDIAFGPNGRFYTAEASLVSPQEGWIKEFYIPQNLASLTTTNGAQLSLTLPAGSNITAHQIISDPVSDTGHTYPLGLLDFTFDTTNGASVPITFTVQTSLQPSEVTVRKYNATTHTYATVSSATVTGTTLNGQPALSVSYTVTDGGDLDQDGSVNGVIVDPVGLATTTPLAAPNTGLTKHVGPLFSVSLIALGISLAAFRVSAVRRFVYAAIAQKA